MRPTNIDDDGNDTGGDDVEPPMRALLGAFSRFSATDAPRVQLDDFDTR